ncbi:D-3-phosphoglycerate dehydrogenase, putative [Streptomyces malaysiensis subsp. malaysiensis]|nr:D-3-phosphoglycerate dehydrogenase, putative [Streptomyces malaysiensis]
MPTTVLAAGDHFVLPRLLTQELRNAVPGDGELEIRELRLPWPHTPFGKVAEVDEASGGEEEIIEALRGSRICVTQMAPLTERVLWACPDLELFCVSRGGPVNANTAPGARSSTMTRCATPWRAGIWAARGSMSTPPNPSRPAPGCCPHPASS